MAQLIFVNTICDKAFHARTEIIMSASFFMRGFGLS